MPMTAEHCFQLIAHAVYLFSYAILMSPPPLLINVHHQRFGITKKPREQEGSATNQFARDAPLRLGLYANKMVITSIFFFARCILVALQVYTFLLMFWRSRPYDVAALTLDAPPCCEEPIDPHRDVDVMKRPTSLLELFVGLPSCMEGCVPSCALAGMSHCQTYSFQCHWVGSKRVQS